LKAVNAAFYTKSCVGFLLVLNMSVIVSFNINRVYENRLNDKEEAQKVVNEFYEHLMDKQFDKTYPLLADSFYYYTDKAALLNMYNFIWDTCGNITDTSQVAWETFVLEGTNPMSKYTFLYSVLREDRNTKEIINLIKEEGEVKILKYNVDIATNPNHEVALFR